jgi:glucosamine--fructose-6-phosphate aminotransferase (isomerizing)
MADPRQTHPFWMHEEILVQPDAVRGVLAAQADSVARLAATLRGCGRVFLVGTGTSYHAAALATWIVQLENIPITALAVPAYDFVTYPIALRSDDAVIVISHRGTKQFTTQVLERACAAHVPAILVTGQGAHEAPAGAEVLRTCHQDRSPAHTVSYTSALSLLALLLADVAGDARLRQEVLALPALLAEALHGETAVREIAERYRNRQRIYFVGGGPHALTAREGALKVKETSYLISEGFATEQLLHGPLQAIDADDVIVAIAPAGPSLARLHDLFAAAAEIGAARIAIVSDQSLDADATIAIPSTRESLSPIVSTLAVQLFAYWSAVARGKNPDGFRSDDPRYERAKTRYQL